MANLKKTSLTYKSYKCPSLHLNTLTFPTADVCMTASFEYIEWHIVLQIFPLFQIEINEITRQY